MAVVLLSYQFCQGKTAYVFCPATKKKNYHNVYRLTQKVKLLSFTQFSAYVCTLELNMLLYTCLTF